MGTVTQLDPPIPVMTPKGAGFAHILIDYGQEHHLYWVVAQDDTCEFWTWENLKVRIQLNHTMDRYKSSIPDQSQPKGNLGAAWPVNDLVIRESYNKYQTGKP